MDSGVPGQPTSTFVVRFEFYRVSRYIEYDSGNRCCLCYTNQLLNKESASSSLRAETQLQCLVDSSHGGLTE